MAKLQLALEILYSGLKPSILYKSRFYQVLLLPVAILQTPSCVDIFFTLTLKYQSIAL